MCQRRPESPFSLLSDDCIYYILNMMRWDWIDDTSADMLREQKNARRTRRRQVIADMEAALVGRDGRVAEGDDAVLGVDDDDDDEEDEDDDDDMDEDGTHGSDADTGSLDSAVSDEYAWGDHVSSRNAFVYNDDESLSEESDEGDGVGAVAEVRRGQQGMLRARRSILSFLRAEGGA
jgi:hypothetical protein